MFRVSLALQPIATALWANSPFRAGKPSGFQSYRAHIWSDTDPDRTGNLPFVFEPGFGFERYVDYVLDIPMYFYYRKGMYHDVSGQSFREFMIGNLKGHEGCLPSLIDFQNHLSTAFPEVRLKTFLEMRGADGGQWDRLCALPAFWVGLLYNTEARAEAFDLIKDWTAEERASMARDIPKNALKSPFRKGTIRDVALEVLRISRRGLTARNCLDGCGLDEGHFLRPLVRIAESGLTPADELLAQYERMWGRMVDPVFTEYAY